MCVRSGKFFLIILVLENKISVIFCHSQICHRWNKISQRLKVYERLYVHKVFNFDINFLKEFKTGLEFGCCHASHPPKKIVHCIEFSTKLPETMNSEEKNL